VLDVVCGETVVVVAVPPELTEFPELVVTVGLAVTWVDVFVVFPAMTTFDVFVPVPALVVMAVLVPAPANSYTSSALFRVVTGDTMVPPVRIAPSDARPPIMLPAPSSDIIEKIRATRLPRREEMSISSRLPLIEADTSLCSSTKRLPPPCPGIPVSVPQEARNMVPASVVVNKSDRLIRGVPQ
jgi:hypothetical protein